MSFVGGVHHDRWLDTDRTFVDYISEVDQDGRYSGYSWDTETRTNIYNGTGIRDTYTLMHNTRSKYYAYSNNRIVSWTSLTPRLPGIRNMHTLLIVSLCIHVLQVVSLGAPTRVKKCGPTCFLLPDTGIRAVFHQIYMVEYRRGVQFFKINLTISWLITRQTLGLFAKK